MKTLRTFCSVVETDIEGLGIVIVDETYPAFDNASEDDLIDIANVLDGLADEVHTMVEMKRKGII